MCSFCISTCKIKNEVTLFLFLQMWKHIKIPKWEWILTNNLSQFVHLTLLIAYGTLLWENKAVKLLHRRVIYMYVGRTVRKLNSRATAKGSHVCTKQLQNGVVSCIRVWQNCNIKYLRDMVIQNISDCFFPSHVCSYLITIP